MAENKEEIIRRLQVQLDQVIRLMSQRKSPSRILTYSESRVLSLISRYRDSNGKLPLSDLARLASLAPSALSQLLRGLERRELITREPSTVDRRAVLVSLTAEGKKIAKSIDADLQESVSALYDELGPDDTAKFSELLATVIEFEERSANRF